MTRRIVHLQSPSDVAREKHCAHCGGRFAKDPRNTWAYWSKAKYCSQACAGLAWRQRAAKKRPSFSEAFWARVVRGAENACWGWKGCTDKSGYPIFVYQRKNYRANRVALELSGRPASKNQYACHTCDNPRCVNPAHLYPGTPTQNMRDAVARGRTQRGSRRYCAKLTEADVTAIRATDAPAGELAKRYGVSASNIHMIRSRRTWRHVP